MGTTAEKLTYLNTTKQNLKTVINTTGAGLTDESTFRSYANVLNDKILGAINGDVDLFEEYPKVSGNGTDLSLNGVVEGKMAITPQGVSSQGGEPTPTTPISVKSVTGENSLIISNENLFDKNTVTNKYYLDNTGTPISNTSRGYSDYIPILPNTAYTLSGVSDIGVAASRCYYDKNKNFIIGVSYNKTNPFTDVSPTNAYYMRESFYITSINTTQTEKGSIPTTYVEHEEQNYPISLGNIELNSSPDGTIRDGIYGSSDVSYNLLDINHLTAGIFYTTSGAIGTNSVWSQSDYILVQSNTSYVLSSTYKTADSSFEITQFDKNKNWISTEQMSLGTEKIRTTEANTKYIRIGLRNDRVLEYQTQFTEGSEVKPYFPYGQVGMWYKREYIYKFIITGNEGWQKYSTNRYYLVNPLIPVPIKYRGGTYCTHFKWNINQQSSILNNCIYSAGSTANLEIYPSQEFLSEYDTNQKFKTWLQSEYSNNNPVIAYYQRAESVDIPITDTTLINQLNDIYNNAHSYNGVTNITTTYEDGNEQMYLDIEALKNVWEVTE